jgi:hypothetical protein
MMLKPQPKRPVPACLKNFMSKASLLKYPNTEQIPRKRHTTAPITLFLGSAAGFFGGAFFREA